jgi:hypothetical protein
MYEEKRDYFKGLCLYLHDADPDLYGECLSSPRGTWRDSNGVVKSVYKHDVEKGTVLLVPLSLSDLLISSVDGRDVGAYRKLL